MAHQNQNLKQMKQEPTLYHGFTFIMGSRIERHMIYRKRSQKGAEKELKKGTERKQAILNLIVETPTITQKQLMNELALTRKQIQTDIKELQEEGKLEREGSNRNGRWVIKNID